MYCNVLNRVHVPVQSPDPKYVPDLPPKPRRLSSDHKIEEKCNPLSNHSFSDPSLYCYSDYSPERQCDANSTCKYNEDTTYPCLLNKQKYVSVYDQANVRPSLWGRYMNQNDHRPGDAHQIGDGGMLRREPYQIQQSYPTPQVATSREIAVPPGPKSSREQPQVRALRGRCFQNTNGQNSQREYHRQDYHNNKSQDYVHKISKSNDVHKIEVNDSSPKTNEYQTTEYTKSDFSSKDYSIKPLLSPSPQKLNPVSPFTMSGTPSPMRDQTSRVTSPPTKLLDSQKTPQAKGSHDFVKGELSSVPTQVGLPVGSPEGISGHFVQQYPERDTSNNMKNICPAWEGSYIYMSDKYITSNEHYPNNKEIPIQVGNTVTSKQGVEKVIDAYDPKETSYNSIKDHQPPTKLKNNRLSPLGSDSKGDEQFCERPEKDFEGLQDSERPDVLKKIPLTVPQQNDIDGLSKLNKPLNLPRSLALRNDGRLTPESTDCGSLSKSSSDGDHMINRKRPPTKLKSKRRNILSFPQHLSIDEIRGIQRRQDSYCGSSSSDENRSSGHASMSDGHSSSSPPVDTLPRHNHARTNLKIVPEDDRLAVGVGGSGYNGRFHQYNDIPSRRLPLGPRHYANAPKDEFSLSLEGASGIDDIKQAIEHLTMRSQGSRTSYSTSTYSSMSGSEGEPMRRLVRHSSLDTINTNITSADEFVWVDSHNRLVELQQLPWSNHDVLRVIQQGRIREQLDRVSMEAVPRLSYLLQRALVRIAREAQRLTRPLAMCSKREVSSAFKIVLSPALSDSCIKACLRSAAMYTVCGDQLRQGKSTRAGLNLSVSRFMRWMCDVRLGKFIHEYAAVYMTAGMENLLEELILQCLPCEKDQLLTASALEHAIANNGDLWGLLQPYAHLNAGRSATGALCLPRWARGVSSDRMSAGSSSSIEMEKEVEMSGGGGNSPSSGSMTSGIGGSTSGSSLGDANCSSSTCGVNPPSRCSSTVALGHDDNQSRNMKVRMSMQSMEQTLLTTCVGSLTDLGEQVHRVVPLLQKVTNSAGSPKPPVTWGRSAIHALFYFMRCSQLEHAEHISRAPIQELVYERPYIVLPPLVEWVRVATAHTEHRHSTVVDKDDVMQASRLLLPGVDCPVRMIGYEELICPRRQLDEVECAKKFKVDLAFKMLSCGRADLVAHALQLLPSTKVNTVNEYGLTPLMLACIRGDEPMVRMLLENGSDVDCETPPTGPSYLMANPETQHWTALTYAAIHGNISIARILLEHHANVEGGARLSEEKCTETPLQVASAAGHLEMMSLLLSHGANPYLSTLMKDSLSYSGAAQKGCYASIAVAAAHGQRTALHKLLAQPQHIPSREVLSLEEILAEGSQSPEKEHQHSTINVEEEPAGYSSPIIETSQGIKLTKQQIKTLQEAMYHSAESGHLEMTLDLRNLEVPWTLHCWMHTLATAHEHRLESIIDQLLQDFLQEWPEDYNAQFVDECLPLLFTIFRYSKNEGTSLLLADIFTTCFGKDPIKEIRDTSISAGARIDPKYVNNPELSDVQFRVEGRVFYAHKLILVNASPRFEQMLTSKVCEGNSPIVQIHDIRYNIFEFVMQSLYKGGCENLDVDSSDVLELMAAANFFQLDSLLRYCEARCSQKVDLESVVSMYVHAKVYEAMQLLEFCQGFLLQNMVALLTYDDSVRRLIFGKKLHNHDVLSGLLLTLQARIKSRASPRAGRKRVVKDSPTEQGDFFPR